MLPNGTEHTYAAAELADRFTADPAGMGVLARKRDPGYIVPPDKEPVSVDDTGSFGRFCNLYLHFLS